MAKQRFSKKTVFFLNPKTCGIYKSGGTRLKVDQHGRRMSEVDNELLEQVQAFISGKNPPGASTAPSSKAVDGVLVPRYFDKRWNDPFDSLLKKKGISALTIGQLIDQKILSVRGGHGSPGNDQRVGAVPYVKVSDIRNLRININPTNLVPLELAKRFWRSQDGDSGLRAWDVLTPNRASANIGEFALILPGEEQVVLTKEMFIFRIVGGQMNGWDPFYLLWCLCLKPVRLQWQRVTLMQTNREDVGDRYREIRLPDPPSRDWALEVSAPFRKYFKTIAKAKEAFKQEVSSSGYEFIASVFSDTVSVEASEAEGDGDGDGAQDVQAVS